MDDHTRPTRMLVLPDSTTRRETLDWLRIDLEKLQKISDLVSYQSAAHR